MTLNRTNIEWVKNPDGTKGYVWNPVWGCLNNCDFCYAKKFAKRFCNHIFKKEIEDYVRKHPTWAWTGDHLSGLKDFKPTWLESNFNKQFPKKPSSIFVNSMSDIYYWKLYWLLKVLEKIEKHQCQHSFFFLTKKPFAVYSDWGFPNNCWLGTTVTSDIDIHINILEKMKNKTFLSIEPIHSSIWLNYYFKNYDWIIVGAETGNRKNKITPKKKWIEDIKKYCQDNNITYFEKDSLQKIVDRDLIQEVPINKNK